MADELTTAKATAYGVLVGASNIAMSFTMAVEAKRTKKPLWHITPIRITHIGIILYTVTRIIQVYSQYAFVGASQAGHEALSAMSVVIGLWLISSILVATAVEVISLRNLVKLEETISVRTTRYQRH